MALLYIGTFGSFIGYSAAFPTLLKVVFERPDIALTGASSAPSSARCPARSAAGSPTGSAGRSSRSRSFVVMAVAGVVAVVGVQPRACRSSSPASWCCSSRPASATARPTG